MVDVTTWDRSGGNVIYKALTHPLAVAPLRALEGALAGRRFAVYDPEGMLPTLLAFHPGLRPAAILTHDSLAVGRDDGHGGTLLPLTALMGDGERGSPKALEGVEDVLALSFDGPRMAERFKAILGGRTLHTLAAARLPESWLERDKPYLDKGHFVTNFAFFRDDGRFSTRLTTADYWSGYGARNLRYWFRLMDAQGQTLAEWEHPITSPGATVVVDSTEVRRRFGLGPFTGQLFVHVIGARGHDVLKYALDTIGKPGEDSLSVTHDANPWPAGRYGSLPAPRAGEELVVWVQNSHGTAIPDGAITFNPMGVAAEGAPMPGGPLGPYATRAVDVGALLPNTRWPAQIETRAGHHIVRPRYEMTPHGGQGAAQEGQGGAGLTRIAHLNVMRADIKPDPALEAMPAVMGRGFLMPFPVLDPKSHETWFQPNPMSEALESLPARLDVFDQAGTLKASHFLGNLPRAFKGAWPVHEWTDAPGHAELVYDFSAGGVADGWPHGMARYRHKATGHEAESSFGGHIYNSLMTWRSEPQSYAGPPPGLSTRIFLKLGHGAQGRALTSFCCLIHPVSGEGGAPSQTELRLHGADGALIAVKTLSVPPRGSLMLRPHELFSASDISQAADGYVMLRDRTCRLFGYHGLEDSAGRFSLDHMFGF
ncbi:hypothetical protein E3E12_07275 [Formicincola oecophyllae]|uniref:Uncharacterized protein n=1 Tax=Formicincola oecophyllae TaxID=2558361 RepID=A0A4Y6U9F8_9PROT|nr:hypothetical protein [Formicincola oecophyllae]QDH14012.1 hypothetical protein E3E12_07275 [Formicincola oecophyllae]